MKISQNEGVWDRMVRIVLSEVFFLGGFFWLGGILQGVAYFLGGVLLLTGVFGFCGIYTMVGKSTCPVDKKPVSQWTKMVFIVLFLLILVLGAYWSIFFSRKVFLDDFNRMNNFYKQTLFFTGQDSRDEAIMNYDQLVAQFNEFSDKYRQYHPYVIKGDSQFNSDLEKVSQTIVGLEEQVRSGDLKQAHLGFEGIRPVFQEMLKRNGFSMLAVYLVDFHDVMEQVIEAADAKDASGVEAAYKEADAKLKLVEEVANDAEIQMIRQKLEEVRDLAKKGQVDELSSKAAELKGAFVKVYLKRG